MTGPRLVSANRAGAAIMALASLLLLVPPLMILAQGRSSHLRWSWQAPARAFLAGAVLLATTAGLGRLGIKLRRGNASGHWFTAASVFALVAVALLAGLLLLRSGTYLVGVQGEVVH